MSDYTYNFFRVLASWGLIIVAVFGMIVNLIPFWLVSRKKSVSSFHILLLILSIADFVVLAGCLTIYGLTDVWPTFNIFTFPIIAPWVIPIVQIALLISVYATILLSFERYVRVIYICNLRHCRYFNEENFKYYVASLLLLPTLFYFPKFFEYKTVQVERGFATQQVCDETEDLTNCYAPYENSSTLVRNGTSYYNLTVVQFTELRDNFYFRKIYHLVLNTLVSTVIPMVTLLYLNISICKEIRRKTRISRQEFQTLQTQTSQTYKVRRTQSVRVQNGRDNKSDQEGENKIRVVDTTASIQTNPLGQNNVEVNVMIGEIDDDDDLESQENSPQPEGTNSNGDFGNSTPNQSGCFFFKKMFAKNEKTLTRVSILIVWLYLICHFWKIIPNAYEAIHWSDESGSWPIWLDYIAILSHFMIVLNSSINFLVYLIL